MNKKIVVARERRDPDSELMDLGFETWIDPNITGERWDALHAALGIVRFTAAAAWDGDPDAQWYSHPDGRAAVSHGQSMAYEVKMSDPTIGYTTKGGVTGECGHVHRTALAAHDCAARHHRGIVRYNPGCYSDREVVAVWGRGSLGLWTRPMTVEEADALTEALYERMDQEN